MRGVEMTMINNMYQQLSEQSRELISGIPYLTANLANLSALIYQTLEQINWAGFYVMEDGQLVLGPFQGKPACIVIPLGKGVCGTAAKENRTIVVPDVHAFPGHIACDGSSRSEIVVPIHHNGNVIAVLDIDSPVEGRFTEEDEAGLERIVQVIEEWLEQ